MTFPQDKYLFNIAEEGNKYLHQPITPQTRPMDFFSVPDQVPDNRTCDSAIDIFSPTTTGIGPLCFDFTDSLVTPVPSDLFVDPFAAATSIGGFTTRTTEDPASLSPGFESDDYSWYCANPTRPSQVSTTSDPPSLLDESSQPTSSQSPALSHGRSSPTARSLSPEIKAENFNCQPTSESHILSRNGRKKRSFSQDSSSSSASQNPHMRSVAKRVAHNLIEKRYRRNMNAKFFALEKAISPAGSQRQISKPGSGSLKKSEILTSALAYIENIQQEKHALQKELALFRENLLSARVWRQNRLPQSGLEE